MINIAKYRKSAVLATLYNASKTQGLLSGLSTPLMAEEEAQKILDGGTVDFDYLNGRVMKVNLSDSKFDPWLYDRDNGEGAALRAINQIESEPCGD